MHTKKCENAYGIIWSCSSLYVKLADEWSRQVHREDQVPQQVLVNGIYKQISIRYVCKDSINVTKVKTDNDWCN